MTNEETKFCHHCGAEIDIEAATCPSCGLLQHRKSILGQSIGGQAKNAGFAALLSFFINGAGQIYNGQILKGVLLIMIQVVNIFLMFILIGFLTYPIVWIYGVWGAYTTAERINAESV